MCENIEARFVRGNAFKFQIEVIAYTESGRRVESFEIGEAVLKCGNKLPLTVKPYEVVEGTTILVSFDGSDVLGIYGMEMTGTFEGEAWRWAYRKVFQIVETNEAAHLPEGCIVLKDTLFMTADVVVGGGGSVAQVQADWLETDPESPAFIKNKPTIPSITGKADKVSSATSGNFAGLDSNGNLTDSGSKASDFATTSALSGKQDTLVSGTNIKTINNESILGSGNITIEGGGGVAVYSVNGQTGAVVLDAEDVGAATPAQVQSVANDVALLQFAYAGLTQSDIIVGALPESGVANIIYRVPSTSSFSDYMWYGGEFVLLATYSLGFKPIDIALLNKILKNGVYVQNVDGDIEDLIDSLSGEQTIAVVAPSISVSDDFEITITNEDLSNNIRLYYTLDGSTPTADSTEYTTPFKSQYDCTIKAIAINGNDEVSRVTSIEYTAGAVEYIDFADKTVLEPLVVALADTSGDGKVTPAEAGLVANIGTTFKGKAITSFEELNFFTGITELKFQSFSGCSSLKTIRVPKNVTKIDTQSFQGCTDLEMIYLPDGITTMCSCFGGTSGDVSAKLKIAGNKLPSSLSSFSGYAGDNLTFRGCAELELDELPPHFPKISPYAFKGCSKLALTSLPNEITSIGNEAFNGCSKLAITEIPESVSGTIGGYTFKGCSSLVSLNIKGSITGITGDYAFQNCSNLEEIIFPETMTTWSGMFTFYGSDKLTKVVLKSPTVVVLSQTGNGTIGANTNFFVPANLVESYLADTKWGSITNASNRIKAIEE